MRASVLVRVSTAVENAGKKTYKGTHLIGVISPTKTRKYTPKVSTT